MKFRKKTILNAEKYVPGMEDCWVVIDSGNNVQHTALQKGEAETWRHDHGHMAWSVKPAVYAREGAIPVNEDSWIAEDGGFHYPIEDSYIQENYEVVSDN